jgi:hypothetical protein
MTASVADQSSVPRIFISYAHVDSERANEVHAALTAAGFDPWIAHREIRPGDSFLERMNEGLGGAAYVLVLLSEAAKGSRWVTREWMSALAAESTIVVPVILDDTEPPPLLRDIVHFKIDRSNRGIAEIVAFFQREVQAPKPPRVRGQQRPNRVLQSASPRQLRLIANRCLDEAALKSFCFDAEVDMSRLQGTSLQERLISLLHTVTDEGLLASFSGWLEIERKRCVQHSLEVLEKDGGWSWTPTSTDS